MTSHLSTDRPARGSEPGADLVLLQRVADKDRTALEELYRAYHPRVVQFLYRITRSAGLAEETYNDVMLVVWQKASGFQGRSRVSTWILGIAYRKGLKARSKARRRRAQRPFTELELATLREPRSMDDRRLLRDWVAKALDSLPAQQRMVIELAYFLGHSCSEIAEIVDCPVNTVKTRMFHARKKLRGLLPHLGAPISGSPLEESQS